MSSRLRARRDRNGIADSRDGWDRVRGGGMTEMSTEPRTDRVPHGGRMARIVSSANDPVRDAGVAHFLDVWGPRLETWFDTPPVIRFDGATVDGGALTVLPGISSTKIVDVVRFEGVEWPLFTRPEAGAEGTGEGILPTLGSAPLVSLGTGGIRLHADLFKDVGRLLAAEIQSTPHRRDASAPRIPCVDGFERIIAHALVRSQGLETPIGRPVEWPDNRDFAVVLTHDIDRVRKSFHYFTHAWRAFRRLDVQGLGVQLRSLLEKIGGSEPYWTFDRIRDIETTRKVRSTFLFLEERGRPGLTPASWRLFAGRYRLSDPDVSRLIQDLAAERWEIALHASYRSVDRRDLLADEKAELERVAGQAVRGVRQHYFRLKGFETWRFHEQTGLRYDMSVGSAASPGFVRGTCFPFRPWPQDEPSPLAILEIPTTVMDAALLYQNMKDLRVLHNAWGVAEDLVNRVHACGGVFNLLWHNQMFSEPDFPGGGVMYERLLDLCRHRGAWFATGGDLARFWDRRLAGHPSSR